MLLYITVEGKSYSNFVSSLKDFGDMLPLSTLIHLWLGHEKVKTFGFVKRWIYSDSLDRYLLSKMIKKFTLKYGNTEYGIDYVFGPHANVIIPALIEMGIFGKVVTQLLEEEKFSTVKRRREVTMMISKPEIGELLVSARTKFFPGFFDGGTFWKNGASEFFELREGFTKGLDST